MSDLVNDCQRKFYMSKNIKFIRSIYGYTQGKFADLTGISKRTLQKYESWKEYASINDEVAVSLMFLVKVCDTYGITLQTFVFEDMSIDSKYKNELDKTGGSLSKVAAGGKTAAANAQNKNKSKSKIGNKNIIAILSIIVFLIMFMTSSGAFMKDGDFGQDNGSSFVEAGAGTKYDNKNFVYVTKSGEKYHRADCSSIRNSKGVFRIKREEARKSNYTPCKICSPDEY